VRGNKASARGVVEGMTALTAFAADARRLAADPHAIGVRLGALLAGGGWLAPEHRVPDRDSYRQHLLYVAPERNVSIVALVWLPGQTTPIHDHVSWCVVGVYERTRCPLPLEPLPALR
jgi:predicted metal-dependent enzyme (double-stranded beta helix superfamily)